MGEAEVYYFSGTGNSLVLAKLVAERLGGALIPIASVIDREKIEPAADVIGITFPVYYADAPNIVRRFAEKLANTEGKYIFAISNYGGGAAVRSRPWIASSDRTGRRCRQALACTRRRTRSTSLGR